MGEINPLSKVLSLLISFICGEDTISVRGSFAVQSWDHFWSWDHLIIIIIIIIIVTLFKCRMYLALLC